MTRKTKTNVPASILGRLLVRSKKTGDEYQTLLTAYACERFLFVSLLQRYATFGSRNRRRMCAASVMP
jgi:hypothetical protein